jgi:hypothetical protein
MSLDVYLYRNKQSDNTDADSLEKSEEPLYWANITHNLGAMAKAAGIYQALWRPEEINATQAKDIVDIVKDGLIDMALNPSVYEKYDSPNGWGLYKHFLPWVSKYYEALRDNPEAYIYVSR